MFTIGADPELFVSRGGSFVSAQGLVPGTKEEPFIVPNGAVQVDGMALEFNVNPAHTYEDFQNNLDVVLSVLLEMVPGYEVLPLPAITLDPDYKKTLPPESLIRGCSPDLNAYTEEPNTGPDEACDIHAAGGHIHVGNIFSDELSDAERYKMSLRLTRLMDKHVGVYSVLWDSDSLRRQVYGKAGSLRLKPYGMEYRTLSNGWLFNKNITKFVYEGTARAVESLLKGEDVEDESYRQIINGSENLHSFFKNNEQALRVKSFLS